jgi:hypothetical protein
MTDTSKPDPKATVSAFNRQIRDEHSRHRVQVTPATSTTALNDALRRAAGRDPRHEEESEGTHPWRSLGSGDGDA